jgi:hypothetical protein
LDKKVESRVVSAGRHGMGVKSAKTLTSVVQELFRLPTLQDVYRKRVGATGLTLVEKASDLMTD